MSTADDLKRLNDETQARIDAILDQAPPDLRKKLAQAKETQAPDSGETVNLRGLATRAENAVHDLGAARTKAERAVADFEKIKNRRNVPAWLVVLVVAGFVAFFLYLAYAHC
jgi:hypothetical protein